MNSLTFGRSPRCTLAMTSSVASATNSSTDSFSKGGGMLIELATPSNRQPSGFDTGGAMLDRVASGPSPDRFPECNPPPSRRALRTFESAESPDRAPEAVTWPHAPAAPIPIERTVDWAKDPTQPVRVGRNSRNRQPADARDPRPAWLLQDVGARSFAGVPEPSFAAISETAWVVV